MRHGLIGAIALGASLTARGESLAAFDGRCTPAGCVAPRSNTPGILGRPAWPAGRLARLGATPDFHHGLLIPSVVTAQERGSLVGQGGGSTGAVLPGGPVDASRPALIERVRSPVSDSAGRYAVVDLRPGTYTVSFALPGFKTVKREGIVLEGAFAATVNASLEVGAIEETVTVAGASPVVDLQSTQNQSVLNRQILDVLPAARTMQGGASLVPGVSFYSQGFTSNMTIHGSLREDQHIYFDGMNIGQNLTQNGQQANGVSVNELAQAELVYDAGSQSAEAAVGGGRRDSISREGGQPDFGLPRAFGSEGRFQNDQITPGLEPVLA